MKLTTRSKIMTLGQQRGFNVEFSPFGPAEVTADERLVVHAPFYPLMGRKALEKTVRAIRTHDDDEVLRAAVEEERKHLRLTPGMLERLRD
jgi:hypothetical protein